MGSGSAQGSGVGAGAGMGVGAGEEGRKQSVKRGTDVASWGDSQVRSQNTVSGAGEVESNRDVGRSPKGVEERISETHSAPQAQVLTNQLNSLDPKPSQGFAGTWSENLAQPKADHTSSHKTSTEQKQAAEAPPAFSLPARNPFSAEAQNGAKTEASQPSDRLPTTIQVLTEQSNDTHSFPTVESAQRLQKSEPEDGRLEDEVPMNYLNDAIQETEAEQNEYDSLNPLQSQEFRGNLQNNLSALASENRRVVQVEEDEVDETFDFRDDNEDELMDGPVLSAILNGFIHARRQG